MHSQVVPMVRHFLPQKAVKHPFSPFFLAHRYRFYPLIVLTLRKFLPSFSQVARELEGKKEAYGNAEWEERIEKWKIRQEKRGLVTKDASEKDGFEEDNFL